MSSTLHRLEIWWSLLQSGKPGSWMGMGFAFLTLTGSILCWILAVLGPSRSRVVAEKTAGTQTSEVFIIENSVVAVSLVYLALRLVVIGCFVELTLMRSYPRYREADRDKKTAAAFHTTRASAELLSWICILPLVGRIFITSTADLDAFEMNWLSFFAVVMYVVYVTELSYRSGPIAWATKLHHAGVISAVALFLDGKRGTESSYFMFLVFQGFFVAAEYIEHGAMAVYHLSEQRSRVLFFLCWAILHEILSKTALTVMWIYFYVEHFSLFQPEIAIFILCFAIVLTPAQFYGPYVLLIILEKEYKRLAQQTVEEKDACEGTNYETEVDLGPPVDREDNGGGNKSVEIVSQASNISTSTMTCVDVEG